MDKKFISAGEVAEKWGISVRSVQNLCKNGKVAGAVRFGNSWSIPVDAEKPEDGRRKAEVMVQKWHKPLLRKTPFLLMSDLFNRSGSADDAVRAVAGNPEAEALLKSELAYARGDIDTAYGYCRLFLENNSGFYAVISGGMIVALCALWKGDVDLYRRARRHMYEAPCKTDLDRDIVHLSIAVTDLYIRNVRDFPEWFQKGRYDRLPPDAFPAARIQYLKYLMVGTQILAANNMDFAGCKATDVMKTHPFLIESFISNSVGENSVKEQIHLRLLAAICYTHIGERNDACMHLDKAIELCKADGFYGILAEYHRSLGTILDEELDKVAPDIAQTVKKLSKTYNEGWTRVHNLVLERSVYAKLTSREREVARLAAFGLSNKEIAERFFLSEASVESIIKNAKDKTGAVSRSDLGAYI